MLMRSWVRFLALALAFPVSAQTAAPKVFRITPVRPVAELIREAKAASPPAESGTFRLADLVDVAAMDSSIHLDVRYATTNNFLSTPV